MAYRMMSYHRAFFSPYYVGGSSSRLATAMTRYLSFEVKTQKDFEDKVLKADRPVVVDFHATWCGPCKVLAPRLSEVMDSFGDKADLAKVDIDELTDLAMEYEVVSVPTVAAFRGGKMTDKFVGAVDLNKIETFVEKLVGDS